MSAEDLAEDSLYFGNLPRDTNRGRPSGRSVVAIALRLSEGRGYAGQRAWREQVADTRHSPEALVADT